MPTLTAQTVSETGSLIDEDIELTEQQVRTAVSIANVPALLMLVFQMTGDEKWLQEPYLPSRGRGLGDHDDGGLPEATQTEIREAAIDVILRLQSGEKPAIEAPSPALITRMMSICMGEQVGDQYGPMLSTEFARRVLSDAPELQVPLVKAPVGYQAVVIGAGIAGIVAAHQLEEMGLEYVILEKQPEVGGNWWQNTYPGAGVDTPSHLYSFSFAQNDWTKHFELRDNLQHYFDEATDAVGARDRIRFGTEVLTSTFDENAFQWILEVRNADGVVETLHCDLMISAVGVLNRPKVPDVPGRDSFEGTAFHSAEWPTGLDLKGKRVAIVGTGASSMQIVPAIVDEVAELTVFQRSPQWVAPFEKFQQPISDDLRLLLQSCTLYRAWYWLRLFWQFGDKVIEALRIDPDWAHPDRSVNARNDGHRIFFTKYITEQLEGREDLLEKAIPNYPPFGKRILLDNGWYEALKKDHVTLVDEAVVEIRPDGIVSTSGEEYGVDIVIWATGFEATRFLSSMDIRGVGGVRLREVWEDDNPKAYLGVSVPEFPNFFMLGGPNSFPGSGSFMFFMEVQMRYIRGLLTEMFKAGHRGIESKKEASDKYNELVDETHNRTVWTHPGMTTYYRNSRGRVIFVMPFLNVEYWEMTKRPDLENYKLS